MAPGVPAPYTLSTPSPGLVTSEGLAHSGALTNARTPSGSSTSSAVPPLSTVVRPAPVVVVVVTTGRGTATTSPLVAPRTDDRNIKALWVVGVVVVVVVVVVAAAAAVCDCVRAASVMAPVKRPKSTAVGAEEALPEFTTTT